MQANTVHPLASQVPFAANMSHDSSLNRTSQPATSNGQISLFFNGERGRGPTLVPLNIEAASRMAATDDPPTYPGTPSPNTLAAMGLTRSQNTLMVNTIVSTSSTCVHVCQYSFWD